MHKSWAFNNLILAINTNTNTNIKIKIVVVVKVQVVLEMVVKVVFMAIMECMKVNRIIHKKEQEE